MEINYENMPKNCPFLTTEQAEIYEKECNINNKSNDKNCCENKKTVDVNSMQSIVDFLDNLNYTLYTTNETIQIEELKKLLLILYNEITINYSSETIKSFLIVSLYNILKKENNIKLTENSTDNQEEFDSIDTMVTLIHPKMKQLIRTLM